MSLENIRETIESRFKTQWSTTTPIQYEGVPFDPPTNAPWVAIWVSSPSVRDRINLGSNPGIREIGILQIDINVPETKSYIGNTVRNTLAEQALQIFQFEQVNGITFGKAAMVDNPGIKKSGWNRMFISIDYKADTLS